jgi:hypothetical protein
MPRNPETSKKTAVSLTSDNSVVSLKSKTQPLTRDEMITLNKIYNEAIVRLTRTIDLLDSLEEYLSSKEDKNNKRNIKQLLINEKVHSELHTLKMIKRHFYIEITDNSINNILCHIERLRDTVLKTLRGLEGQLDVSLLNIVYISDISLKRQNNKQNDDLGYVHRDDNGVRYGAIHIDYRLLKNKKYLAMQTLVHEAFHRYGWVTDKGYYYGTKNIKNTNKTRPYPDEVKQNTALALNNAESHEYFVCEMTNERCLYTAKNLPVWRNQEKYKNKNKLLPKEHDSVDKYNSKSQLLRYSLFGVVGVATIAAIAITAVHSAYPGGRRQSA